MNIQNTHFAKIDAINDYYCNNIYRNAVVITTMVVVMTSESTKNRHKHKRLSRFFKVQFILS